MFTSMEGNSLHCTYISIYQEDSIRILSGPLERREDNLELYSVSISRALSTYAAQTLTLSTDSAVAPPSVETQQVVCPSVVHGDETSRLSGGSPSSMGWDPEPCLYKKESWRRGTRLSA